MTIGCDLMTVGESAAMIFAPAEVTGEQQTTISRSRIDSEEPRVLSSPSQETVCKLLRSVADPIA